MIEFPTDYNAIIERVNRVDAVHYGSTRNFIDGAVTYLSPYLSRGVISTAQVRESVLAKGDHPATIEKFLQELAWREYFQRVWQAKGDELFFDLKQSQADVVHYKMVAAIEKANTGIIAIDKLIKEFYQTGYLHNHVRMYIASMACNIAKAHWLTPSRWMYYHLLDGDLASNTCSWQWVAGAFSSKKYYCNQENINRYTRSTQTNTFLDFATGSLSNFPIPEVLESTVDVPLTTMLPKAEECNLDTRKPTLIYNSYNLDPRWRSHEDVNRVLLLEPSHFQKYPVSERVLDFIMALAKNIPDIKIVVGEVSELEAAYKDSTLGKRALISKEHPAFRHYPGTKDEREWMYPQVSGYFNSFFSYWKKCT